jgi:hypothetical protein
MGVAGRTQATPVALLLLMDKVRAKDAGISSSWGSKRYE